MVRRVTWHVAITAIARSLSSIQVVFKPASVSVVFEYLLHVAEVKLHFLQHIFLRKMRHHFFGEHSHAVKHLALLKSSRSESPSD